MITPGNYQRHITIFPCKLMPIYGPELTIRLGEPRGVAVVVEALAALEFSHTLCGV
jgi:hypothetical protein